MFCTDDEGERRLRSHPISEDHGRIHALHGKHSVEHELGRDRLSVESIVRIRAQVSERVRSDSLLGRDARRPVGLPELSRVVYRLRKQEWQSATLLSKEWNVDSQTQFDQCELHRLSGLYRKLGREAPRCNKYFYCLY